MRKAGDVRVYALPVSAAAGSRKAHAVSGSADGFSGGGLGDFVAGLLSPILAEFKANSLSAVRARALDADPDLIRKEFQRARESILGHCSSRPAGEIITRCQPNAKAARRAARLELTEAGIHGCPDHAKNAARLRSDMDEVEHARVAKHVYLKYDKDTPDDLKPPPPGYLEAGPEELAKLGLRQDMLTPQGTSFRAAVYKKDPLVWGENPKPAFGVVFRGSTLAKEDWVNNFSQNANNESSYYQRAVDIGNKIGQAGAIDDVHLVGHSLGGGLTSAAQGGSGATASTFNSAGLHPSTVARYSKLPDRQHADPGKILAHQVDGEVVTRMQEHGLISYFANPAVGQRHAIAPSSQALSSEDRHDIDEVIKSIEARKAADEAVIKNCLGLP